MKAIRANREELRQEWFAHFADDNAENRFQARMLLRERGVERFRYERAYSISTDSIMLRVSGMGS